MVMRAGNGFYGAVDVIFRCRPIGNRDSHVMSSPPGRTTHPTGPFGLYIVDDTPCPVVGSEMNQYLIQDDVVAYGHAID